MIRGPLWQADSVYAGAPWSSASTVVVVRGKRIAREAPVGTGMCDGKIGAWLVRVDVR